MEKKTNWAAIVALVCGILAIVGAWFLAVLGIVLGVLGIVFGGIGMKMAKTTNSEKGLAIGGLVTGIIGTAIGFLVVLLRLLAIAAATEAVLVAIL